MQFLDRLIHKTLRIPYTLYVHEYRRVKKAKTTLVLLHGVGASGAAWEAVLEKIKNDPVNILVVDLLGFGKSPKPEWAQYSAEMQSRALSKTLFLKGVLGRVTLVGHSMGALIAVEFAKRKSRFVRSLVLLSPPLYDDKTNGYLPDRDEQLLKIYSLATNHPDYLIKIGALAKKYGLVGRAFVVSPDTVDDYISALKAAVINQTSLEDITHLDVPISIVYGTLDPFIVGANIKKISKNCSNINVQTFIGGHELEGRYVQFAVRAVQGQYEVGNNG
jgi:pimeloyl-ACP methyl ester carboxylesterase